MFDKKNICSDSYLCMYSTHACVMRYMRYGRFSCLLVHDLSARYLLDTFVGQAMPQADLVAALIRDFDHRVTAPPPEVTSPTQ